jgi:hypothetical protein
MARLLACTVVVLLASSASAFGKVLIFSEHPDGFFAKPERLGYTSGEVTSQGFTVSLKDMHWGDWGSRRARGQGRGKVCAPMSPCPVGPLTAIAKGRFSSKGGRFYKTLVVKQGDTKVKLCVNPEVCA